MRFNLRDLFWLCLVIGLGIALWCDRVRLQQLEYGAWQWKAESLAQRWRELGGEVQWIDTGNGNGWGALYTDPEFE